MKIRSCLAWAVSSFVPLLVVSCVGSPPSDPVDDGDENLGEAAQSLVTDCAYLDPGITPPLAVPVDFDREGMITDLSVVEDPCRTTWAPTAACAPGTIGAWTFATLMANMAGTTPVGQFVAEWLDTFETPQTVNTFPVNPRANFRTTFLDRWLIASGCNAGDPIVGPGACSLDLKIAPFRLLAVVNRLDLQGFTYGGDSPGEARLVFGWLGLPKSGFFNKKGQLNGNPLAATVIFEYKLPPTRDFCDWGNLWHNLSSTPFGTTYNNILHKIVAEFSSAGVNPAAPNKGNSIGQVRTNDIDLGNQWVLREYQLQDVGRGFNGFALANAPTAQTPDDSMNNHPDLNNWVLANEPDVINTAHSVPVVDPLSGTPFLGGESSETGFVWEDTFTPPLSIDGRYNFGFSGCNDCHTGATATGFTHVGPRSIGGTAPLSTYMSQPIIPNTGSPGLPQFTMTVSDPFPSGSTFEFNEPWRRVCELNRVLRCIKKPYTRSNGGVH